MASRCEAYVQNTPSAFKDAYWSVNSLKVYQLLATSERMFVNGTTSSMSLSVAVATKTALTGSVNGSLSRTIANTSSEAGLGGHFSTLPSGANTMSNKTSAQPSVATAKVTLNSTHSAYGNSSGSVTVSAGLGTAIMQAKSSTLLHARPIYTLPALSASYIASGDEYETVGIPPSSARRRHAGHLLSHRKRHWN